MQPITVVRDQLISWYGKDSELTKLESTICYDISNVAEYAKQFEEAKPLSEITFAIPPWPFVYAEWNNTFKNVNTRLTYVVKTTENKLDDAKRWCLDIHIINVHDNKIGLHYRGKIYLTTQGMPLSTNWETSWNNEWCSTAEFNERIIQSFINLRNKTQIRLDEAKKAGASAELLKEAEELVEHCTKTIDHRKNSDKFGTDFGQVIPDESMMIFFLATMLANCKNVKSEAIITPAKLLKARIKRNQVAIEKVYTLVIDPMRKSITNSDPTNKLTYEKAWHICRGHFKEFTKERPLFGKVCGRFWWPMHVRGSIESGKVEKDYKLEQNNELV